MCCGNYCKVHESLTKKSHEQEHEHETIQLFEMGVSMGSYAVAGNVTSSGKLSL